MDDDGSYQFSYTEPPNPAPQPGQDLSSAPSNQPASPPTPISSNQTAQAGQTIYTGLSGNELYCLNLIGYNPGNLIVGNSVYSMGFIGGIASNIRTTIGGEIKQYTNMISEGRRLSIQRMEKELLTAGGQGATGVNSELIFHPGNVEFLSVGSTIYRSDNQQSNPVTSASDGQGFFCQVDAGYMPQRFVFGNVAYSIGVGRNFLGELKELTKGEIKQFSDAFSVTRNAALERIANEARQVGANCVTGIRTTIIPVGPKGIQEMIMVGTAAYNQQLVQIASTMGGVLTSDLTEEEMWGVTKIGYVPLKLILGTSVYSLGVVGGLRAAIRGYFKGEITTLTQMIYGAREESLKKVQQQAQAVGADDVLGIKTYIYQLGGDVIEFLAIGTAVKRVSGLTAHSEQLPPQAIIRDRDTFINSVDTVFGTTLNQQLPNTSGPQKPGQHSV
jgi:uncharacterized protein YbjQ (UPF0145 family)